MNEQQLTTLRKALWVIQKLAGSLGIDLDELDENYDNVVKDIRDLLETNNGDKK